MSSTSSASKFEASKIFLSDQEYDVFLSFRGPDTRVGFTDHLYKRLIDADIRVYKDDEELQKGEEIGPELLQAIKKSAIAIPVFSKRYAESKWCLKELVEIMNRMRSREMKVMPIFYNITPYEIRNQTGHYEEAFVSHKQRYDDTIIGEWKQALNEIGALSGWEIPSNTYSLEGKLVEDVTKEISFALKKAYVKIPDHLIGLDCHVKRILKMLTLEAPGVRIIGIHGMGGIGKTTLARFVYNYLLPKFQGSSFLADARSKNMEDLKKNLRYDILARKSSNHIDMGTIARRFADKKVLIVIDDADEETQIEGLIGERGEQDWFASGSRIIITTRNEGFLRQVQVNESYELSEMGQDHSHELFCRHAFRSINPKAEYSVLSRKIVQTTGGLPLALEIIGCSLRNKCKEEWERKLEKLKQVPAKDVSKRLRISYEELDERQKHIFLDIACFFIGEDQRVVIHFWDPIQFYPKEALDVLQQKSLIKIHDHRLRMHDQIRDLGREIARENNIMKPEKQTRLWNTEEAKKFLFTKKGLDEVQGICLGPYGPSANYLSFEEFRKLPDVRLLWVNKKEPYWFRKHSGLAISPFQLSSGIAQTNLSSEKACILSEVRWLLWHGLDCTDTDEAVEFSLGNLVILDLSESDLTTSWAGWRSIDMAKDLKVLNLMGCRQLVRTPKFSSHLQLERLIFEGCSRLVEIDDSISMLRHLVHLNLKRCSSLRKLPTQLSCMGSLTELFIDWTAVYKIPPWRSMAKLEVFSADSCRWLQNCISLNNLTSLKRLSLAWTSIASIPDSIGELVNLKELSFSGSEITSIPNSIGELVNLKELSLLGTQITSIPDSIGKLINLSNLNLRLCERLNKLPKSIGGFKSLIDLNLWGSGVKELPNSIGDLKELKRLNVHGTPIRELPTEINKAMKLEDIDARGCENLCGLPMLPQSLISLRFSSKSMQEIPDLSTLINLRRLWVCLSGENMPSAGAEIPSLWWMGRLSELNELHLEDCNFVKSIPELPSSLRKLTVLACKSLETLSDLSHVQNLSTLKISGAPLIKLEGLWMGGLSIMEELHLEGCNFLKSIPKLPSSLTKLTVLDCESLETLSDLSHVEKLSALKLENCSISEINGLPENLTALEIIRSYPLKIISQISNCKKLEEFHLRGCYYLTEIHGRLGRLHRLSIENCYDLVKIPDVMNVKTLHFLEIKSCPELCHDDISHEGHIFVESSLTSKEVIRTLMKICDHSRKRKAKELKQKK